MRVPVLGAHGKLIGSKTCLVSVGTVSCKGAYKTVQNNDSMEKRTTCYNMRLKRKIEEEGKNPIIVFCPDITLLQHETEKRKNPLIVFRRDITLLHTT